MLATSRGFRTGTSPTSRDLDGLRSHELSLYLGLTILEEHRHDLLEILAKFVDGGSLGMCTGPTRDVADEKTCGLVSLDDGREATHRRKCSAPDAG
jgi:hypothetical protein